MDRKSAIIIVLSVALAASMLISVFAVTSNYNLYATVKATQETGIHGTKFSVTLPDGRVVIAGAIMNAEAAQRYFYEYQDGDTLVKRISSDTLIGGKPVIHTVMTRIYVDPVQLKQKK